MRIVNDPVELVPLFVVFNNTHYKKILELLDKNWMTRTELCDVVGTEYVRDGLLLLRKGNLIEEKWRMPEPGKKPEKEYKANYCKFRANFQCNFSDLGDLLSIAFTNQDDLRMKGDSVEAEISRGNTSISDIARKFGVSPMFIKGIAKRIPHLDVKGQGLVVLDE
ncbi:ArsR family transcriptional regulator [Methanospirillum sp.]|uniref:ArsR family transcriptional regulator n=1 Tax=Methanospirillum sp. TaxID=45200 RepID=UPI002D1FB91D|nr:ArsR family transcriptional regulator [Methanospirillum sp.]